MLMQSALRRLEREIELQVPGTGWDSIVCPRSIDFPWNRVHRFECHLWSLVDSSVWELWIHQNEYIRFENIHFICICTIKRFSQLYSCCSSSIIQIICIYICNYLKEILVKKYSSIIQEFLCKILLFEKYFGDLSNSLKECVLPLKVLEKFNFDTLDLCEIFKAIILKRMPGSRNS